MLVTELGLSTDEFSAAAPDPLRPHFRPHDLRRPEGNPLILAVIKGNNDMVRQLVEAGFTIKKLCTTFVFFINCFINHLFLVSRPHKHYCSCRECTLVLKFKNLISLFFNLFFLET